MIKNVLKKKVAYEGCPIYIRNSGEDWEYLTVINNEIYSASIVATKSAMQKITGKDYSVKELSDITNYMIAMAQATIDTVLGIKHTETPYVNPPTYQDPPKGA